MIYVNLVYQNHCTKSEHSQILHSRVLCKIDFLCNKQSIFLISKNIYFQKDSTDHSQIFHSSFDRLNWRISSGISFGEIWNLFRVQRTSWLKKIGYLINLKTLRTIYTVTNHLNGSANLLGTKWFEINHQEVGSAILFGSFCIDCQNDDIWPILFNQRVVVK